MNTTRPLLSGICRYRGHQRSYPATILLRSALPRKNIQYDSFAAHFSSNTDDDKKRKRGESNNTRTDNILKSKSNIPNNTKLLESEELDVATRAVGQVIFLNSVNSGRMICLSLAIVDPTLAACAALGSFTSLTTAKIIGLDNQTYKDGLWGYNGVLIGCAAKVFGPSFLPLTVAYTILGAAVTPILSATLKNTTSIPQWTWSFNIVALTPLLRSRPLLESSSIDAGGEDMVSANIASTPDFTDIVLSPLLGISQIFVVGSPITGAGTLASIYIYSPKLAYHAIGGSTVGCLVGLLLGADLYDITFGLWGYNSALSSMAVGTFFVHSRQTMILSIFSAAVSAVAFGSMQTLFGTYGVPCLTLPFCATASVSLRCVCLQLLFLHCVPHSYIYLLLNYQACYLLEGQIPGLKLASEPHSPEKNYS